MSIISVKSLRRQFRIPKTKPGIIGGLSSLFHREYEIKTALNNISFEIEKGELVGYIGPNGAGKSTTVKTLSGILTPDSGEVKVFGKTPWEHRIEVVSKIGVVFGQRTQLWWELPVIESFELLKDIYHISSESYKKALNALSEALELNKLLHVPVRQLSLGQRMRCDIAATLLHSPEILFLDEPTIGLDASSKLAVRSFISRINKEHGVTIMLTTHDMDDIEALCPRVIVLNEGQIYLDGSINALRKKISPERHLIVDLVHDEQITDPEALSILKEDKKVTLTFDPKKTQAQALIARIAAKHAIHDLIIENPSIEEIIAKFYKNVNL